MFPPNVGDKISETKNVKIGTSSLRDPSLSSRHVLSERQEYAESYGSNEIPHYSSQMRHRSQKERTKHHHHNKSRELAFEALGQEQKPVEVKASDYEDYKFDPFGATTGE
ncbi:hypothetical protein Ancab_004133 [Ancistrocladus abbreviatus]